MTHRIQLDQTMYDETVHPYAKKEMLLGKKKKTGCKKAEINKDLG